MVWRVNDEKISGVIPVYNEEDVLELSYKKIKETLENISEYNYEMIFVNDVSKDRTLEMLEYNKFVRGLFSWVGFKQYAYTYKRNERLGGKTKYPFKKMWKLATDGIISFSTKPLKIVGSIGFLTIILSICILIYSLISYSLKLNNLTPGWTSIMVAITLFSGVQLLSIWIISEYISRIYDETRQRPQYVIEKKINLD